ncbi:DUF1178 family protein [Alphaproteobacteria bacterium]|jgi:hypothetical protein|nr:DUF1178 family protein [Alphaproteobacteria bacterium]
MILFNLRCSKDHQFEAWFKDGATFEKQSKAGEVSCPVCGDGNIVKAPMAPRIASARNSATGEGEQEKYAKLRQMMVKVREEVEQNCDYVGREFAEEARKIHYDEVESRNIYGETTDDDARALEEEGVAFTSIPWISRTDS